MAYKKYAYFLETFYLNGCWILSKTFSASLEIIIWFFIFPFVNMIYHIDLSVNIEGSQHPWNKAYLITMYDLFIMLLDSIC